MAQQKTLVVPEKPGAIVSTDRPSFIDPKDQTGIQKSGKDDLIMPRLALAQPVSPEVMPGDPKNIPGLSVGQAFNTLTGDVYGSGPFEFVLIYEDQPRAIEFDPDTKAVIDFDVPLDDPRLQFTDGPNGERLKPRATKFYDFLIALLPSEDLIGLSFKGTGVKAARMLRTLAEYGGGPLYSRKYKLSVTMQKNQKGTFAVYNVANAGWIQDEDLFNRMKSLHETVAASKFSIDRAGAADEREPGQEG